MLQEPIDTDNSEPHASALHLPPPIGAAAFTIHGAANRLEAPIVYVAASPRRAAAILQILQALDAERMVALYPPWDALPHEMTPPSALAMGRRMSVLRWLTDPVHRPSIVVTTADAVIRRVPPRSIWRDAHIELRVGDRVETDLQTVRALEAELKDRFGAPPQAVETLLAIARLRAAAAACGIRRLEAGSRAIALTPVGAAGRCLKALERLSATALMKARVVLS